MIYKCMRDRKTDILCIKAFPLGISFMWTHAVHCEELQPVKVQKTIVFRECFNIHLEYPYHGTHLAATFRIVVCRTYDPRCNYAVNIAASGPSMVWIQCGVG